MEKFIIVKDVLKKVRRFNLIGRELEFKIKPLPVNEEPVSWIRKAINQVIQRGTEDLQPRDQVSFSFCCKDLKRGEGWIRFRPAEEISYDDVWNVISSVYQSNSTGLNTDSFCLAITSVRMPTGRGKANTGRYNTFEEECRKRRGIIVINNKDNMCLPRALVVTKAYVEKDPEQNKVRRDHGKLQTQRAHQLCTDSGVVVPEEGCGIPELRQFQQYLKNFKLMVYKYGTKGRDMMFKGSSEGPSLNILYHEGHYNAITSLTAAFACGYYCEDCHIPYNTKNKHRCGGTCWACQQSPACPQALKVKCEDCKRSFNGQICYNNHKKAGSMGRDIVCEKIRKCEECCKVVNSKRQHTCGEIYCKICNTHVPQNHLCYIQPDTGKPKVKDVLFIFYDLETRQEKLSDDGSLIHEPNLCVFRQYCDVCIDENINKKMCTKCGVRLQILRNKPIENFLQFVLNQRQIFKHVIVVAHNGSAFDHAFMLNYILTKTDLKPDLVMRGTKIILLKIGNVKLLDSINYFPMALSKLPKAFDLPAIFKKGYFPHLFNTKDNESYIGPLPAIEYYDADNMKEDVREKFLKWYEIHKNDEFKMEQDIVEYCISDVEILAQACLKFRYQLLETGRVCPFTEACTIAGACNKVYRRNFLKPNTIGIIPKNGYRWREHQSKIAIQWLVWEEEQRQISIVHSAKQQEAVVQGVKVDGFCSETKQIFEFHGCYYHGCPSCFKYNRDEPLHDDPNETLNTRYESTVAKRERLSQFNYEVIEKWECVFKTELNEEKVRTFTENHPLITACPLNPRDSFYGGRTGNTYEYYICQSNEKIKYVDICSLYPWVCKYGKFPLRHPTVYVGQDCSKINLNQTNGLIKCKILPPRDLYHPVLPLKTNNKLMFVLCRTCGEQMNQSDCCHDAEERMLTGTWVIDEVIKALEKGYEMNEIYEIWSYEIQEYDKTTKNSGLFTEMMDRFLKIKQQASGWPSNCITKEEQDKYIEDFLNNEGVQLEFTEILSNPGLRSLAKLILNSFWGKFGQGENQAKTKIVRDPDELFGMYADPRIYINAILPIDEHTLVVNYEFSEEAYESLNTVNVVIAAYVTAQARLKLYSYLEQIGDRVLYYDTDSVIYVSRPGEFDVPTGEFVGDMTDELDAYGSGSYIEEFVSGGPKNYAYKLISTKYNEEKTVCKVKGISLNHATSQLINFKCIKDMILETSEPVNIFSKNIRRTKEYEVVTKIETKIYKPNSTKRKFSDDHSSVPYGYKKCKT